MHIVSVHQLAVDIADESFLNVLYPGLLSRCRARQGQLAVETAYESFLSLLYPTTYIYI